ncbi:MAG TPA: hypothetical protein VE596_17525 [Gaiellaceae bacterium]|nr:hypothetical protein [Gaiellaceae bacterium]
MSAAASGEIDNAAADFQFLAEATLRLIATLHVELRRVQSQAYAVSPHSSFTGESSSEARTADVHQAVHLLELILEATAAQVRDALADFGSSSHEYRLSLARFVRFHNFNIRSLHRAIPWLEAAAASRVPLGARYLLEEAVSALLRPRANLILVPEAAYSYTTEPSPFRELAESLFIEYPEEPLLIVAYFPVREDRALLYPLLVHEIAHRAVDEHSLRVEALASASSELSGVPAELAKARAQLAASGSLDADTIKLRVDDLFAQWVEEILCDALALAYLGPGYLLPFAATVHAMTSPGIPYEGHPTSALRLRVMHDAMKVSGWWTILEAALPRIIPWLEYVSSRPRADVQSYPEALDQAVLLLAPGIFEAAKRHLGDRWFTVEQFAAPESEIIEMLQDEIFPAQLTSGEAPDRRAIVCATWFHMLGSDAVPADLHAAISDDRMNAFLMKAIEMSIVLDAWRGEASSSFGDAF